MHPECPITHCYPIVPFEIHILVLSSSSCSFVPSTDRCICTIKQQQYYPMPSTLRISFPYESSRNNQIKLNFYCEGKLCKSQMREQTCWLAAWISESTGALECLLGAFDTWKAIEQINEWNCNFMTSSITTLQYWHATEVVLTPPCTHIERECIYANQLRWVWRTLASAPRPQDKRG